MGFKPRFNSNIFSHVNFVANEFEDLSFQFSRFENITLKENNLIHSNFLDTKFSKTHFNGNKLTEAHFHDAIFEDIDFNGNVDIGVVSGAKINNSRFDFISLPNNAAIGLDGATLTNSSIELKNFHGSFAYGNGSGNIFQNFLFKTENFGSAGDDLPIPKNIYKNINCRFLLISGKNENCLWENIDTEIFAGGAIHLKNCTFRNIRIREFVNIADSKFENVKWENITIDPKCEIRATGSTYKDKLPFK